MWRGDCGNETGWCDGVVVVVVVETGWQCGIVVRQKSVTLERRQNSSTGGGSGGVEGGWKK